MFSLRKFVSKLINRNTNDTGHLQQCCYFIESGELIKNRFDEKTREETKVEKRLEDGDRVESPGQLIRYWYR